MGNEASGHKAWERDRVKLSDLDQAFIDRLTNWGRWCMSQRQQAPGSWLYHLCLRLAVARGKTITDGWRELKPRTLDPQDAEIIERVITEGKLTRFDRDLIAAYFVWNEDPRKTCRVLDCSRRAWESMLCMAIVSLQDVVDNSPIPV